MRQTGKQQADCRPCHGLGMQMQMRMPIFYRPQPTTRPQKAKGGTAGRHEDKLEGP